MFRVVTSFLAFAFLVGCNNEDNSADIIIHNANIFTVDSQNPSADFIAIKDGIIIEVGNEGPTMEELKGPNTSMIDGKEKFLMPGFIEGHGHFSGLGESLIDLNLLKAKSWEEIVGLVEEKVNDAKPGEWIIGRGWHQEKWDSIASPNIHSYPYHYDLSAVSPENPVVLTHASGHSLFANAKAMEVSSISKETPDPVGGAIVRDRNGEAIGVFEERAMRPIRENLRAYQSTLDQEELDKKWLKAIELAQKECLSKGITSFQDAGSKFDELQKYKDLASEGKLDLRLWVMARDTFGAIKQNIKSAKAIGVGNNFYTCNAIKSEVDGALGAFGAWLLEPYNDKPGFMGQNTTDIYDVKRIADLAVENDMQFCVHAIGDRANRVVLDIYEGMISSDSTKSDWRWRIEHAQHLDPEDIPRFAKFGIIASMQGVHCTSDAPFVEKRLGRERAMLGAYAWRSLLDEGVIIANGTDAPVEDVDPLLSFYASVTRKRVDNGFEFFPEQAMTREEAIYSYTLGNAYAAFEDHYKGSIEKGKVADLVLLSNDLIECEDDEILSTKVLLTMVDGKVKYQESF